MLILADVIWPAMLLEGRLLSWWAILAGLLVEYCFVRWLTTLSAGRAVWADIAMNAASSLLGIIFIPLIGIGWEYFPGIVLYKVFDIGTFNPGTWAFTFCMAVGVNAALETFVLIKFFKQPIGKRGFWWLCVANALSVGVAFGSLFVYPPRT